MLMRTFHLIFTFPTGFRIFQKYFWDFVCAERKILQATAAKSIELITK
jgi:iron-sulfur cluster repair protein YtfE (RIC family)